MNLADDQYVNLLLAAQTALTSTERAKFMSRFPHRKGTAVAVMLSELGDHESHHAIGAPLIERHGDEADPALIAVATQLGIGLYDSRILHESWELVSGLIERIRPLLGLSTWELAEEQAKREQLELLEPLGFKDFDDAEFPNDVYHPLLGPVHYRETHLSDIVALAFKKGKERGADELRGQLRALLDVQQTLRPNGDE